MHRQRSVKGKLCSVIVAPLGHLLYFVLDVVLKRRKRRKPIFVPTLDTTIKFVIMTIRLLRNLRLRGKCVAISQNYADIFYLIV